MCFPALAFVVPLVTCTSTSSTVQNPPPPPSEYRSSKIDLYLGGRSLDQGDWSPVEDQVVIGVEFVHEGHDAPVGFEVAFFYSEDSQDNVSSPAGPIDVTGETEEISAGIRKTFLKDDSRFHPYIGGGLSAIRAKFKGESPTGSGSDDDTSAAFYLHGGVDFDLGPAFLLGADLRYLGASDITLFGANGNADYLQFAIVLGVRF
jgi:opacity protein-like surface antigen